MLPEGVSASTPVAIDLPGFAEAIGPMADARPRLDTDAQADGHGAADAPADPNAPRDMSGAIFDARIHAQKRDGTPSITRGGVFRRRRGVGPSARGPTPGRLNLAPEPTSGGLGLTGSDAAGASMAGLFVMAGMMTLGEDFKPDDAAEMDSLCEAFQAYCDAKGIDDFPPGVALVLACGMYAAKRLPKPTVQARMAGIIGWVRERFSRARSYFGSNRLRENHTSEAASARRSWFRGSGADTGPQPAPVG